MRAGLTIEQVFQATKIDRWFLQQFAEIIELERSIAASRGRELTDSELAHAKRDGLSDATIGALRGESSSEVRACRIAKKIAPVYSRVDTCAAEFVAQTPYMFSTWGTSCEAAPTERRKIMILGCC